VAQPAPHGEVQTLTDHQKAANRPVGGAASGLSLRELAELIHEDYLTHDRNWGLPGLHAVILQRVGAWRLGLPPSVRRQSVSLVYRTLYTLIRNVYGIQIPDATRLGRRVKVLDQGGIVVDSAVSIGDGCTIGHGVTIGHATVGSGAPQIGTDVEMNVGAVLIGPITVGDGAKIGPNAVVLVDVPAGSTVFVPPARRMPARGEPDRSEIAPDDASAAK
jgi:serine O-acetyltransferase